MFGLSIWPHACLIYSISTKKTPLMTLQDHIYQHQSNMSNSSQKSKTYFILNNTWNTFYYFFRIFGVYPCVQDEENNSLKPRSIFCIWAHFICTFLIVNTIFVCIPVSYIIFEETTPNLFLEHLYDVHFQNGTSAIAMICNFAIYSNLGFLCLHKLRILSVGLSDFQNYYNNHSQIILNEEKITSQLKKLHFYTLLYVFMVYCGVILMNIFISFELKLNLNLSLVSTILYIFGTLISTIPSVMPILYFILIYFEIIIFLSIWCDCIKNVLLDNSLIKEANIFIGGLDLISKIFSHFLFWITFALLFHMVMMSYYTFATFWDRNNFHFWQFHTMASVLFVLSTVIILYELCTFSESMAKKVKLRHKLIYI